MVTLTAASGGEVEGRRMDDELSDALFGAGATDIAKVSALNRFVMQQLALVLAIRQGWTFANAEAYIADHITIMN